jgi:hypothetical protein
VEDGPDDQKRPPRSPYGLPLDALQLGQMFANVVPDSTLEQVQKAIASGLLTQFRAADFIVPPQFKLAELVATARFADFAVPEGLLASWRQSLLLSETVTEAMKEWELKLNPVYAGLLADIEWATSLSSQISESAVLAGVSGITAAIAAAPTRQLRGFLDSLPTLPSPRDLTIATRASIAVAGFNAFDIVSLDDAPAPTVERVEIDVLSPWREGPQAARKELLRRLKEIDPELADLLIGAWDEAVHAGPAAVVKLTGCAVELIERVLRALAGDSEVTAWYGESGRPKMDTDNGGGPTYAARARFVLEGKRERRLVVSQIDAVVAQVAPLRGIFQAGKHASAGSLTSLRIHLMSTEALLMQLLELD